MVRSIRTNQAWIAFTLGLAMAGNAVAGSRGAVAQTPKPMTQERTDEVMRAYLDALLSNGRFAEYFADGIVVTLVDVGHQIVGRDAAEAATTDFHQVAFAAAIELQSFVAGSGMAYAEMQFRGTHTGDFFGIPATGREVSVPYAAVWELSGDRITALRLYGPASALVQQLTAGNTPES